MMVVVVVEVEYLGEKARVCVPICLRGSMFRARRSSSKIGKAAELMERKTLQFE